MFENRLRNRIYFLITSFILSSICALIWGYMAIAYYVQTGFIALLIGFVLGSVSAVFVIKQYKRWYLFATWLFCVYAILGGMYLDFAYLYSIKFFTMADSKTISVLGDIIVSVNWQSIVDFFGFKATHDVFYTFFWTLICLLLAFRQYHLAPSIKSKYQRWLNLLTSPRQ